MAVRCRGCRTVKKRDRKKAQYIFILGKAMKAFHRYDKYIIKGIVAAGEVVILNLLLLLMVHMYPNALHVSEASYFYDDRVRILFSVINFSYVLALSWVGIVLDQRTVFVEKVLNRVFRLSLMFFVLSFIFLYVLKLFVSVKFLLLYVTLVFVVFSCWRMLVRLVLQTYRSHGGNTRSIIILGSGSVANDVYQKLVRNISYGYKFLGFFDDRDPQNYKVDPSLVKGRLDDAMQYVDTQEVDEIFCALPAGDDRKALPIIVEADKRLIHFQIVPDFRRFIKKKVELSFLEDLPVVSLRPEPLQKVQNRVVKRLFDIFVSFVFLVTVFPLLYLVFGTIIKLTSKGPVFFKQKRTGENGRDFYCYKFRTMQVNKDADSLQATKGDARVTRIGAFMRKTNIDEMPQFFNVFIGNMSLVGPRPHMLKHTEQYSKLIGEYMLRHLVKPGITGWAQVTGFRGETQTLEQMEGRVKRDVWYVENWSFLLDLKIMFMTVYNMIKGDSNAY